jgi:nitrate reductase NapAB chaperone NapD
MLYLSFSHSINSSSTHLVISCNRLCNVCKMRSQHQLGDVVVCQATCLGRVDEHAMIDLESLHSVINIRLVYESSIAFERSQSP